MKVEFELLKNEMVGVTFDYDAVRVAELRRLQNRRWNARKRRWEVHLAHLEDLMSIFGLGPGDLPSTITEPYQKSWASCRLRVTLSVLEGRLSGAGVPVDEIDAATSFFIPGHKFSPKFKAKKWDGKRHLFSRRTMKFPAGLWPRIQRILEDRKIDCAVEKSKPASVPKLKCAPARTELRSYQKAVLETAVKKGRGIIQIATGGGKTILAAHLIRRLGVRTLFFVHTRELLHQSAGVFEEELGIPIGRLGDGFAELGAVTVVTLQTAAGVLGLTDSPGAPERPDDLEEGEPERPTALAERRDEIRAEILKAGLVIFDECHHVPAERAYKIAQATSRASLRFGLSATPWRDDGHDLLLEAALGEKIASTTCSELIGQGYLVRPRITMESVAPAGVLGARVPYPEVYRRAIVENQSRNRVIATRARDLASKGCSVLILVKQVAHGRLLQELLPEARLAFGSMETALRRSYLDELERKLHLILIATTLADEGLDIPSLDAVILAGGGKSATKAYQRIGRALRPAAGKTQAQITDFFDRAPFLMEHSLARLRLYRDEPAFSVETIGFEA